MGNKQSIGGEMVGSHDELEKGLLQMFSDPKATPMSLPFDFLKDITHNFSTELVLGKGGFGMVYKGVLRSGKIIAVKKLFVVRLEEKAFQNEVRSLIRIKHQNVVQFLGYCAESSWKAMEKPGESGEHIFPEMPKRLLCFEYVSNKSLDKHIYADSLGLEWNMRYKIIKGICSGLHYLHEKCHIVHLDLKPENILMDSTMTPKIADFGLSRIFGEQQSRIITNNHAGTLGYMAPEYLSRGEVSMKADIFSLGVILVEIITGRRDYPYFQQDNPQSTETSLQQFTEKVLGSWKNRLVSTPTCAMKIYTQQVRQCITVALKCVDPSMEKRPTIKDIIQMVNKVDQIIFMKETREKDMVLLAVNKTEPWIILRQRQYGYGLYGEYDIWNYDTRKSMGSVKTGEESTVVKFIERKQWFIAGSQKGFIHVYNYKTDQVQEIASFRAKEHAFAIDSLAIHPTKPYVLSSCYQYIQLWDWDKNWECIQIFGRYRSTGQLTFNPKDTNSFAGTSSNHTVKVWSLDSPLIHEFPGDKNNPYTLDGHSAYVNCMDFFTCDGRHYVITGSNDKTANIWDLQEKTCINTQRFDTSVVSVVCHPSLPVLFIGTKANSIHLWSWSSTKFRLKKIYDIGNFGDANDRVSITCLTGSRRVVIGDDRTLSMMEIQDEEEEEPL